MAVLIDYNAIAISIITTQKIELDENLIRHMILNSIRMYRRKFKEKYGEIVICADAGGNWRKKYFPQYKANRKQYRDDSGLDWNKVFEIITKVYDEIKEVFPYKCVKVDNCEGDDIIGVICESTQEFGQQEPIMIVSPDRDFAQLQKWPNINQFSTRTKKLIKEKDPKNTLFEHICKGDSGDGVPNILSPDNTFVEGLRQKPIRQTKLDQWKNSNNLKDDMDQETYRNYHRNQMMIDLTKIPDKYKEIILNKYNQEPIGNASGVVGYLIKNRCRQLVEQANDFIF